MKLTKRNLVITIIYIIILIISMLLGIEGFELVYLALVIGAFILYLSSGKNRLDNAFIKNKEMLKVAEPIITKILNEEKLTEINKHDLEKVRKFIKWNMED